MRRSPAPGPPSTKMTVTLLLSNIGAFEVVAVVASAFVFSLCTFCSASCFFMCNAPVILSTMVGMIL